MITPKQEASLSTRPLRIAYIVGNFPCTSETFIVNQISGVAARGNQVNIFTTTTGQKDDIPSIVKRYGLMERVYPLYAGKSYPSRIIKVLGLLILYWWRDPVAVFHAFNTIRKKGLSGSIRLVYATLSLISLGERQYDVIHAQFGDYGLFALDLVDVGAISGKIVTSFRGYDATQHIKAEPDMYCELFRRGALFLPVSEALGKRLVDGGCDPSKIKVHHSGIDCSKLVYGDHKLSNQGVTTLISVARLVDKKGLRYAIEAVASLISTGYEIVYIIVGDGPLRIELVQLITKLAIKGKVSLVGWKTHDETLNLVSTANILLAPSVIAVNGDEEGIPNSAKEAMAMGLPVVATEHGGIPELVEDGASGFLVPESDVDALAERIKYLIDHPESWRVMGRTGRDKVEKEFNIDLLNDELVDLYYQTATQRGLSHEVSGTNVRLDVSTQAENKQDASDYTQKVTGD